MGVIIIFKTCPNNWDKSHGLDSCPLPQPYCMVLVIGELYYGLSDKDDHDTRIIEGGKLLRYIIVYYSTLVPSLNSGLWLSLCILVVI